MRFVVCVVGLIVAGTCAACGGTLSEGTPNTLVVANQFGAKDVIYDLRGDWVGAEGTITIKQDGPAVEGFWTEYHGCCGCPKDHRWFKGVISGIAVNGNRYTCMSPRSENLTLQITEGGDAFWIKALNVDMPWIYEFKRVK